LELVAPGVNINSTANPNEYPYTLYMVDTGASFAAPHVAGVAALIYASKIDPDYDRNGDGYWENDEVRQKLRDTALDLGDPEWDEYYGYGLVNAWYATQRPPADINTDYKVNYRDLYILAYAYGSRPGDPNWDPRADITINNEVDYADLYILAKNYGKTDP
jgi:subtilisin family serine protease